MRGRGSRRDRGGALQLPAAQPQLSELVFARQLLRQLGEVNALTARDRITPLLDAAGALRMRFSDIVVEHPDSDQGKTLSGFCRRFGALFRARAEEARLMAPGKSRSPRLHLFFADPETCLLGISDLHNASPWPLGIPRLRFPAGAPSRSAHKLLEALATLLSAEELQLHLRGGMRAVDLGAAPGGWSWVLAERGLHVTAVDRGKLAAAVLATEMVEHVPADGFTWRPRRKVDWMVCDIVDKPARVTALAGQWLARGDCRATIFNLKLPMQRRYQQVRQSLAALEEILRPVEREFVLRARQLYHDREEVTVLVLPWEPPRGHGR